MSMLGPQEAYRLWAPTYESGNALLEIERRLVGELGPSPLGLRLLDAGCGTGWRLASSGAASAVGVDLSPEMLAQGRRNPRLSEVELIEGDVRALPFPDRTFDLVWCRLVLGYLPDVESAYRELGRVAVPGGSVVVTDFHPGALAAGRRRTFRDASGVHELLTYLHEPRLQLEAAARAGLTLRRAEDAAIGPEVRAFFRGREELYDAHCGEPVVLGLAFVRDG